MVETKRILVTVKAYPNPSKKYGETVCVAGIDIETKKWIRLYPIPFRDLEDKQKFKKYSIIEVKTYKATDDNRPESYKVDSDSIKVLDWLNTKDNWEKRKNFVLPTTSNSLCNIYEECKASGKSLGVFQPHLVEFIYQKIKPSGSDKRESCYAQQDLYCKGKTSIEEVPFDFRYKFFCYNKPECSGHDLAIIDWEINQSYRSWRYKYKQEQILLEKIKGKWLDEICSPKRDIYFFVGNMKRFKDNFMILGVFYPPKKSN